MRFVVLVIFLVSLYSCNNTPVDAPLPDQVEEVLGLNAQEYLGIFPNNAKIAIRTWNGDQFQNLDITRFDDQWTTTDLSTTQYGLGPITQLFSAEIALNALRSGTISVHQKFRDFNVDLNQEASRLDDIKIIHLLNHSSGLANLPGNLAKDVMMNRGNPYADYDISRLYNFMETKADCAFPPGSQYQYSILGYALLGEMIAKRTATTYESLVAQVQDSFQLTSIGVITEGGIVPSGVDGSGDDVEPWIYNALSPAVGMHATPDDLLTFCHTVTTSKNTALNPTTLKPDKSGVGMAWHFNRKEDGNKSYFMSGATGGFSSTIRFDPETNRGIIIMTNVTALYKPAANIEGLADAWIE